MKFQRGNAGRPKGAIGLRTALKAKLKVEEYLLDAKINPVAEVLKLLPMLEPRDQVRTYLELLSFIQAKPKAVEVAPELPPETPAEEDPSKLETDKLLKIVRGEH